MFSERMSVFSERMSVLSVDTQSASACCWPAERGRIARPECHQRTDRCKFRPIFKIKLRFALMATSLLGSSFYYRLFRLTLNPYRQQANVLPMDAEGVSTHAI